MSNRKPRALWILMHHGAEGWLPSIDHAFPWRTKGAALKKIRLLGERGKNYTPFKYVLAATHDSKQ